MFQDGRVVPILARSFLNPYQESPKLFSWFAFILPFYFVTYSYSYSIPIKNILFTKNTSQNRVTRHYTFLLNDFKSFNSLFKVLFIFPSQYLFAIGFPSVFSLGRGISPYWSFNPKKLDSEKTAVGPCHSEDRVFTFYDPPFQESYPNFIFLACFYRLQFVPCGKIFNLGYCMFSRPY